MPPNREDFDANHANGGGVHRGDGGTVRRGLRDTQTVDVFYSFPAARLVVCTETLAQMDALLTKLKSADSTSLIPQRWREAAAAIDIESPLVLLRQYKEPVGAVRYDLAKPQPDKFEPIRVNIDSFALAAPRGDTLQFRLRAITNAPDDARFYFAGFSPALWKWKRTDDTRGFTTDLAFYATGQNHHLSLVLISMFGVQFMI